MAVLPLVLTGIVISFISYDQQLDQSLYLQEKISGVMVDQITDFFTNAVYNQLKTGISLGDLEYLTLEGKKTYLSRLIMYDHPKYKKIFNGVALYDCQKGFIVCEALYEDCSKINFTQKFDSERFFPRICQGREIIGTVFFDDKTGIPYMHIAIPLVDIQTGQPYGGIIANVRLKSIWDMIYDISIGDNGISYLTDAKGMILAHKDPSVVLKKTKVEIFKTKGVFKGVSGKKSLITLQPLHIGPQTFFMVIEQPLKVILLPIFINLSLIGSVIIIALLIALKVEFLAERYVLEPIERLGRKVAQINKGNYTEAIQLDRKDEFGSLADGFNKMGEQIELSFNHLHQEIRDRETLEIKLKEYQDNLEEKVHQRTEDLANANKELKETQSQLIQSAKLASIGELATGITHELNQPLMYIRTGAQLEIRNGVEDLNPDTTFETLEMVVQGTDRMIDIIKHLKSFARQTDFKFNAVQINELLDFSLTLFDMQIRNQSITVKKDYDKELPLVRGNANQLEQVFVNLIGNAVYELEKEPSFITVQTSLQKKDADHVLIRIIDSGPGIHENIIEKIFDPFFTTKKTGEGTGLGLSISYGIIKQHKGEIMASNVKEGGACFEILIPAASY